MRLRNSYGTYPEPHNEDKEGSTRRILRYERMEDDEIGLEDDSDDRQKLG
jgi:hypothetical protein